MGEPLPILDTSLLVRYLVGDHPEQLARAQALIESDQHLGITAVAVLEASHVLRNVYRYERAAVVDALVGLITRDNMVGVGIDRNQMAARLMLCRDSGAVSYGDALLAATAASHDNAPVYTFDRKLHRAGITALIP